MWLNVCLLLIVFAALFVRWYARGPGAAPVLKDFANAVLWIVFSVVIGIPLVAWTISKFFWVISKFVLTLWPFWVSVFSLLNSAYVVVLW